MKLLRLLAVFAIALLAISWFSQTQFWKKTDARHFSKLAAPSGRDHTKKKLEQKAALARKFVSQKEYNDKICFLVDMSLPSGHNRFFIYDLEKDSLRSSGLVAHGNCFQNWLEGRQYSNRVGSGCTSLGKYRIGNPYTGKFGYSYKLHGLDSSNNNAFERTVVLHSHSCVPESQVVDEICQSNGCPTVSPGMLLQLKAIINASKKPVLL